MLPNLEVYIAEDVLGESFQRLSTRIQARVGVLTAWLDRGNDAPGELGMVYSGLQRSGS